MEESNQFTSCTSIDYDIIFVGQLGAIVCNILLSSSSLPAKCLVINYTQKLIQPSLLPISDSVVYIKKICPKLTDFQTGRIFKLYPEDKEISMENKKRYRYKFLVFGVAAEEWADFGMIQNLRESLLTDYSFVYSNILKSDPKMSKPDIIFQRFESSKNRQLKRVSALCNQSSKINQINCELPETQRFVTPDSSINIIFYVPKSPHGGYDNLNILLKYDQFLESFQRKITQIQKNNGKLIKNSSNEQFKQQEKQIQKLNCILLLQGNSIIPNCKKIDDHIKQQIQAKGIKILYSHKIEKIDYLRRKIQVKKDLPIELVSDEVSQFQKSNLSIGFDYLYIVIKHKAPSILSECKIDPFSNCPKTLVNSQFKSIFIFGADLFPTTYSFTATNYQAHIIAVNLFKSLKNCNKSGDACIDQTMKQYNGFTSFPLWTNQTSYVGFQHEYDYFRDQNLRKNTKIQKEEEKESQNIVIKNSGCCFNWLQTVKHKHLFNVEVNWFYNMKSYGSPFYFFVPQMPKTNTQLNA